MRDPAFPEPLRRLQAAGGPERALAAAAGPSLRVRCADCEVSWDEPLPSRRACEWTRLLLVRSPFECPACRMFTGEVSASDE